MTKVAEIFQCTRCGYCCHGETTVSLDDEDQARMVDVLGGSREEVSARYWRISQILGSTEENSGSIVQMKTVDGHCIFYFQDEEGRGGCRVHGGRPWRCGQWPLHPAILGDENNFQTIRESCPGINTEISYADFCSILRKLMLEGRIRC